jgi:TNF receptor-associated factor 4
VHAFDYIGKRDIDELVLPCSNVGCDDVVERRHSRGHVQTDCLHAVIACKYKGIGCDVELKRKDMAVHEKDGHQHFHVAIISLQQTTKTQREATLALQATVNSQKSVVSKLQDNMQALEDTILSLQTTIKSLRPKIFVLSEYQKKKDESKQYLFPPFYTHPKGYRMALRVYANGRGDGEGTHVSVHAPLLEGENDAELKWPFIGQVTFMLLNQLEDKNHCTIAMVLDANDDARVGTAWGKPEFIPHTALAHDPVRNIQYLKDDTLYFLLSVDVADRKHWLE